MTEELLDLLLEYIDSRVSESLIDPEGECRSNANAIAEELRVIIRSRTAEPAKQCPECGKLLRYSWDFDEHGKQVAAWLCVGFGGSCGYKRTAEPAAAIGIPEREIAHAEPVAGTDGFLVTLCCGHKLATREKHVFYRCSECGKSRIAAAKRCDQGEM